MTAGRQQSIPRVMPAIVQQHADDAASIHSTRSALVRAPHVKLRHLRNFDDRLNAHLEGLRIAGAAADSICAAALESAGIGEIFVATMRALDGRDATGLRRLLAMSESVTGYRRGLISAFGWTAKEGLRGVVGKFLTSGNAFERLVALAACGMHRVDPSLGPARRLEDTDPTVRARAYRTAAELGKREFVSFLAAVAKDEESACQFWAAWSAVLLGDRHSAHSLLTHMGRQAGSFRSRAFQLSIQAMSGGEAHAFLQSLARDPMEIRDVVRGAGLVGEVGYLPWLIQMMSEDPAARLAGESFSLITGLDIAWHNLDRPRPKDFESGPNDDPNDPNVGMDEDDGLPWPDAARIDAWWHANASRFQTGMRYFMGQPLNRDHCLRVLKEGFQRQRIAAAIYLSLLNPGTPLFEWRAPARRQQHLLAEMS
jgi:uncharacterized protein (TIGR02270 family)